MNAFDKLQKTYDESGLDDVKFTLNPEKVADGTIDLENAAKEAVSLIKEIQDLQSGKRKPKYCFTAKGSIQ